MGEKKREKEKKIDRYREFNDNLSHCIKDSFPGIEKFQCKINSIYVSPEGPKAWPNKTGIEIIILFYYS